MTLDDEKIIELMQVKSDLDKAKIEEYLNQLVEQISNLSEGQEFLLDEVGRFFVEEDKLQFEPHPKLATEINYKYAGMQPLEVVGANKVSASSAEREDQKEETELQEKETIAEEDEKESTQRAAAEISEEDTGEEETEEEQPAGEPVTAQESEEKSAPDKENQDEKQPEPVAEENGHPVEESEQKESEKPVKKGKNSIDPRKRKVFNAQDRAQKDSIFSLVNTLVAIVIIIGVGYLVYRFDDIKERRNQRDAGQVTQQQTQQPTNESNEVIDDGNDTGAHNEAEADNSKNQQEVNKADNAGLNEPEQLEDVPESESAQKQKPPKYGLKGVLPEPPLEGYTIVVHSLKNKAAAVTRKNLLRNKNYRALVMGVDLGESDTTWRVGIGQFKTVEDALEATETLESPYKENNFIKRIIQ